MCEVSKHVLCVGRLGVDRRTRRIKVPSYVLTREFVHTSTYYCTYGVCMSKFKRWEFYIGMMAMRNIRPRNLMMYV